MWLSVITAGLSSHAQTFLWEEENQYPAGDFPGWLPSALLHSGNWCWQPRWKMLTHLEVLFQLHQAEACGISLWYNHSASYSSNSLKVGREECGLNVTHLPTITSLSGSSVMDYSTALWKYSWTQICVMAKGGKAHTVGNVYRVITSKDKIHLWRQFKWKKRNSPQLSGRRDEEKCRTQRKWSLKKVLRVCPKYLLVQTPPTPLPSRLFFFPAWPPRGGPPFPSLSNLP